MPYSSLCKRFSGLEAEIDGNLWYKLLTAS